MTYNRVTRAAADVPNASIGHRNKEGRVRGSELYNPEFRDAPIGSEVPGPGGWGGGGGSGVGEGRSRGSCTATRNSDRGRVLGLERLSKRLKPEFPRGAWHCEGLQLWEAEEKSPGK